MNLRASFEPHHGRNTRRAAHRSKANPQAAGSYRANPSSAPRRYEPVARPLNPQSGRYVSPPAERCYSFGPLTPYSTFPVPASTKLTFVQLAAWVCDEVAPGFG